MAKKKTTKKKIARKKAAHVNKSEEIRNFKINNAEAGPTEIAEALGKRGIKVSPNNVSNILAKAGLTKKRKRRGRPKKRPAASVPVSASSNIGQLKAAARFISECGGDMRSAQKVLKDANEIAKVLK